MSPNLQFIVHDRSQEQNRISWYGKRLVIGRRVDADIRVNEPTMSGIHAELVPGDDGAVRIRDLDSLNGTQLNGVRIIESLLRPGDQIQIGRARIVVAPTEGAIPQPLPGMPTTAEPSGQNSQTVKIRLENLRESRGDVIAEDRRIILLRDLFEALKEVENAAETLAKTRFVLYQTFLRARVFIFERGQDGAWRDADAADDDPRRPSMTFVEETASSASAILSTSLTDDQRFAASESVRISGIETAMAAPTSCDGRTLAVIYVDRLGLPPFSLQDLNILGIAANHVSAVLENVSRIRELRRTNADLVEARENLAALNRNLEGLVEERTAEIRRQADEIQTLADAKDELMGIAAHDIRGPLTVIQGTSELLRMRIGQVDRDTLVRSLDMMHGAARGLSQLLSELLDAKAIESGKITLRRRPAAVQDLVEATLPITRLAAEDKGIALVTEISAGLTAHADPRRLGQAITNLLLNAIKFSDPQSRIVLRGRPGDPGRVLLEVEDQGVGIAEADLDRIFGTFEQGTAGRQFGGSGLGLMIARRLVELHDGQLSVESQVGVGSRFIMSLPAA
ncbi:MAG: ATP-binding protein [Acidobacteriota bacterium]